MNPSGPWWAVPLFTLAGVMITLLVAGRRASRFRWTEQKREIYAEFLIACKTLREVPVWPKERSADLAEIGPIVTHISDHSVHTALIAPRSVGERITETVDAAKKLATAIDQIRLDSKPGHQGAVDERRRPQLDQAINTFAEAVTRFTKAARADIDVRRSFQPPFGRSG